jgi:hypothetical protein
MIWRLSSTGQEEDLEKLRLQLRHVESRLHVAAGDNRIDPNLTSIDDVIALKTQVANLMAELEEERHAAREVGAHRQDCFLARAAAPAGLPMTE